MSDYRKEFQDFDPATLPAIPPGWVDSSWHNDACPSFRTMTGHTVFIDFADPAVREWPEAQRFTVHADPETYNHNETLFASDRWEDVIAFLADPKGTVQAEYMAWKAANGLGPDPANPATLTKEQRLWLQDWWHRWGLIVDREEAAAS